MSKYYREKNSLSNQEFQGLIKLLAQRKKAFQTRTSLENVREILAETGLLELLDESDIETVRNQANKQIRNRQFNTKLLLMFVPAFLISPLFFYVGYKLDNFLMSQKVDELVVEITELKTKKTKVNSNNEELKSNITKIEEKNQTLERKNQELQDKITEIKKENEELEKKNQELQKKLDSNNG